MGDTYKIELVHILKSAGMPQVKTPLDVKRTQITQDWAGKLSQLEDLQGVDLSKYDLSALKRFTHNINRQIKDFAKSISQMDIYRPPVDIDARPQAKKIVQETTERYWKSFWGEITKVSTAGYKTAVPTATPVVASLFAPWQEWFKNINSEITEYLRVKLRQYMRALRKPLSRADIEAFIGQETTDVDIFAMKFTKSLVNSFTAGLKGAMPTQSIQAISNVSHNILYETMSRASKVYLSAMESVMKGEPIDIKSLSQHWQMQMIQVRRRLGNAIMNEFKEIAKLRNITPVVNNEAVMKARGWGVFFRELQQLKKQIDTMPIGSKEKSQAKAFITAVENTYNQYKKVFAGMERLNPKEIEDLARQFKAQQWDAIQRAMVDGIMAFLSLSFTFRYLAQSMEKALEVFDKVEESATSLSAMMSSMGDMMGFEKAENEIMAFAERWGLSLDKVAQAFQVATTNSENYSEAMAKLTVASAIAKSTGLSLTKVISDVSAAMEGDARKLKQVARYLGIDMSQGFKEFDPKARIRLAMRMAEQELRPEFMMSRLKNSLAIVGKQIDDTVDAFDLLGLTLANKITTALLGTYESANVFQKAMRGLVGSIGAVAYGFSKLIAVGGQMGMMIFGIIQGFIVMPQKIAPALVALTSSLKTLLVSATSGIPILSRLSSTFAGMSAMSVSMLALGGIITAVVGGVWLLNSALNKMQKALQEAKEQANAYVEALMRKVGSDAISLLGELGKSIEGEVEAGTYKIKNRNLIGSVLFPAEEIRTAYKNIKLSATAEWQELVGLAKQYEKAFQQADKHTMDALRGRIKALSENIITKYNIKGADAEAIKRIINGLVDGSMVALEEGMNKLSEQFKEQVAQAFNKINSFIGQLISFNENYYKKIGDVGRSALMSSMKVINDALKYVADPENVRMLKALKRSAPDLYKQLVPSRSKVVEMAKRTWIESAGYFELIKTKFTGSIKTISDYANNMLSETIRPNIEMPNFDKLYDILYGAEKKTTAEYLSDIASHTKDTADNTNAIKETLKENGGSYTPPGQKIEGITFEAGKYTLIKHIFGGMGNGAGNYMLDWD